MMVGSPRFLSDLHPKAKIDTFYLGAVASLSLKLKLSNLLKSR